MYWYIYSNINIGGTCSDLNYAPPPSLLFGFGFNVYHGCSWEQNGTGLFGLDDTAGAVPWHPERPRRIWGAVTEGLRAICRALWRGRRSKSHAS